MVPHPHIQRKDTLMAANQATLDLSIDGMTCGSCVRHVSDALRSVAGVAGAQVDLGSGRATVSYDPTAVTTEAVLRSVEKAGYRASLEAGETGLPVQRGCSCCG